MVLIANSYFHALCCFHALQRPTLGLFFKLLNFCINGRALLASKFSRLGLAASSLVFFDSSQMIHDTAKYWAEFTCLVRHALSGLSRSHVDVRK
jgi:hypothetical protein